MIFFDEPPVSLRQVASLPIFSVPTIAPLWAELDFREFGSVFYRTSEDPALLALVADKVVTGNSLYANNYSPTFCIIVTWLRAELYRGQFSDTAVRLPLLLQFVMFRKTMSFESIVQTFCGMHAEPCLKNLITISWCLEIAN